MTTIPARMTLAPSGFAVTQIIAPIAKMEIYAPSVINARAVLVNQETPLFAMTTTFARPIPVRQAPEAVFILKLGARVVRLPAPTMEIAQTLKNVLWINV